ncbi:unnamed protein product, partial [Prorocentrum cordatum]
AEAESDVVLFQEIAVAPVDRGMAGASLGRLGWKTSAAHSRDAGGGLSSGVAAAVRPQLGLGEAPIPSRPWPSERVGLKWLNGLVRGGVLIGSVYLVSGGGLDDVSFGILKQLGEALQGLDAVATSGDLANGHPAFCDQAEAQLSLFHGHSASE